MDGFNELYSNLSPNKLSMENVARVKLLSNFQPTTRTFQSFIFHFLVQFFNFFFVSVGN